MFQESCPWKDRTLCGWRRRKEIYMLFLCFLSERKRLTFLWLIYGPKAHFTSGWTWPKLESSGSIQAPNLSGRVLISGAITYCFSGFSHFAEAEEPELGVFSSTFGLSKLSNPPCNKHSKLMISQNVPGWQTIHRPTCYSSCILKYYFWRNVCIDDDRNTCTWYFKNLLLEYFWVESGAIA